MNFIKKIFSYSSSSSSSHKRGWKSPANQQKTKTEEFGLFDNIVGQRDIKQLFCQALDANEPVHILLVGPPSCAKTLFLTDIMEYLRPQDYHYAIGSRSTKAGIADILFEKKPMFMLIDEIEYLTKANQTILLNLMETGIISDTQANSTRQGVFKTWVFGTCNDEKKLLKPLLTRFLVLHIKAYTNQEFIEVSERVLAGRKYGIPISIANKIADCLYKGTNDPTVRDCIKIARLVKTEDEVEETVKRVLRYSSSSSSSSSYSNSKDGSLDR